MKLTTSQIEESRPTTLAQELVLARQNRDQAAAEVTRLERELMQTLEQRQQKSLQTSVGGKTYRLTYARRSTVKVDEAGLKKAIGTRAWNKLTDRRFSNKKLELALDNDELDPMVVAPYLQEQISAPYLRQSEVKK